MTKNKAKHFSPGKDHEENMMVLAAVRYCLGQQTGTVSTCQHWLHNVWPQLPALLQSQILEGITAALMDDDAGSKYDWISWRSFAVALMQESTLAASIRDRLQWKQKPWPYNGLPYESYREEVRKQRE